VRAVGVGGEAVGEGVARGVGHGRQGSGFVSGRSGPGVPARRVRGKPRRGAQPCGQGPSPTRGRTGRGLIRIAAKVNVA
jgi:hypothetical protein